MYLSVEAFDLELAWCGSIRHGRHKKLLKPKRGKVPNRAKLQGQDYKHVVHSITFRRDDLGRDIGIEYNPITGKILDVASGKQAERLGVKRGWQMVNLNGAKFLDDTYKELLCGSEDYSITFRAQDDCKKQSNRRARRTLIKNRRNPWQTLSPMAVQRFRLDDLFQDVGSIVDEFDADEGCIDLDFSDGIFDDTTRSCSDSLSLARSIIAEGGPNSKSKKQSPWDLAILRAEEVGQQYLASVPKRCLRQPQKSNWSAIADRRSVAYCRPTHLKKQSHQARLEANTNARKERQKSQHRRAGRQPATSYLYYSADMSEHFEASGQVVVPLVHGAAASLHLSSDPATREIPPVDSESGEWWTVGIATFDGSMVIESLSVNSATLALALQQRVNEALGMSCLLAMPDGATLSSCETCASIEELGVQDGAILTAVLPISETAIRNQLDFQTVVEDILSRAEALVGDERRFGVLRRMLFNHLTTKKRSSTPVTDVVNQFRRNLGLARVPQSDLLPKMRAESNGAWFWATYSITEEAFSSGLRTIAMESVEELKTRLKLDSSTCPEAWLREELLRVGGDYLELQSSGYKESGNSCKKNARDVRLRIWKHDASCQLLLKPSSYWGTSKLIYKMYLLDGSFDIRGDEIYFTWKHHGFSCDVEEISVFRRTAQQIFVRRTTPWTSHRPPDVCKIAIEHCKLSNGPTDRSELYEVAAALQSTEISHYDSGGF
jgi:hypothetical protein